MSPGERAGLSVLAVLGGLCGVLAGITDSGSHRWFFGGLALGFLAFSAGQWISFWIRGRR